jgi:hypothetical protein
VERADADADAELAAVTAALHSWWSALTLTPTLALTLSLPP